VARRYPEGGRAAGGDRLAVPADELRVPRHRALRGRDPGYGGDPVPGRLGHRRALRWPALARERGTRTDGYIDALRCLLEQVGERPVDGVGEHEGTGDEPDPENDRERGQCE